MRSVAMRPQAPEPIDSSSLIARSAETNALLAQWLGNQLHDAVGKSDTAIRSSAEKFNARRP
jgi:hypothetical protein